MRKLSICLLATLFVGAGLLHLTKPRPFIEIVPPLIPRADVAVTISGVAEIMGGLGLLLPGSRRMACWGLVTLLAAVFPANIYIARQHIQPGGIYLPSALLWARLPFQPLLMWWLVVATTPAK